MTESLPTGNPAQPDYEFGRMYVMEAKDAVNPIIQLDLAGEHVGALHDKLIQYEQRLADPAQVPTDAKYASEWLKHFVSFHVIHSSTGSIEFAGLFQNMQAGPLRQNPRLRNGILEKAGKRQPVSD
jgi:hypothetical protein